MPLLDSFSFVVQCKINGVYSIQMFKLMTRHYDRRYTVSQFMTY
jgi:hypothetical protein